MLPSPPKNPSALVQLNSTAKLFDSGHPQRSIQSRSTCGSILKCGCGGAPVILISEGRGVSLAGRQLFPTQPTKGLLRWLRTHVWHMSGGNGGPIPTGSVSKQHEAISKPASFPDVPTSGHAVRWAAETRNRVYNQRCEELELRAGIYERLCKEIVCPRVQAAREGHGSVDS